ncbi:MAG: hypothetical protein HY064_16400 [Bacteroidetes bacterium]|nr:hypothetical protein [Bacteroidota bacterium]
MPRITPVILFFIFSTILFPRKIFAQDTSGVKTVVKKNYKQEFILNNKRYKVWDNWVNFGAGYSFYTNNPKLQFVMGADFNFHIKSIYLNGGGFLSGDNYGLFNNYEIHLGYIPIRHQNTKFHYAVIASPSYSVQYKYFAPGLYESSAVKSFGFFGEFQFIKKIEYADGVGLAAFFDYTPKNFIIGLRIDGYLSGAYKGYVPGKQPNKGN